VESLTTDPELENSQGHRRLCRSGERHDRSIQSPYVDERAGSDGGTSERSAVGGFAYRFRLGES
jgi:hypothetical protein